MSSAFTPKVVGAFSARNILGDTTGTAVPSGYIGQVISATATGVSMGGSNVSTQLATVSLTGGTWRLLGAATYRKNGATIADQELQAGLTTGSGVAGTVNSKDRVAGSQIGTAVDSLALAPMSYVVNISVTTSYFLNAQAKYTAGTPLYDGYLEAVRIA